MAEGVAVQTMLFADICGSVGLYERRGDREASRLVLATRAALVAIIHRHGGRLAGTAGDGVLGAFPAADQACAAAVDMQRALVGGPVAIRIGLHSGPVIETAGDVFGDTVNTASRVMTLARPSEILLSGEAVRCCTGGPPGECRFLGTRSLEGRLRPVSLYSVMPDAEGQSTLLAPLPPAVASRVAVGVMVLVGVDRAQSLLDREGQTVVLGRDPGCDLVVPHRLASRHHAAITARHGTFVLTDRSTNGTWIATGDDPPAVLRRDSLTLTGRGWIALGEAPPESAAEAGRIRFTVFATGRQGGTGTAAA